MSTLRRTLLPALAQALVLLGLAGLVAFWANAAHPGGLPWKPAAAPAREAPGDEIGLEQARAMHAAGVLFLDARFPADHAAGHIPGSRNTPPDMFSDQLEALLADGPKDRPLVAYCVAVSCPLARELAENLKLLGYAGVKVFPGGMDEWVAGGGPTEAGEGS